MRANRSNTTIPWRIGAAREWDRFILRERGTPAFKLPQPIPTGVFSRAPRQILGRRILAQALLALAFAWYREHNHFSKEEPLTTPQHLSLYTSRHDRVEVCVTVKASVPNASLSQLASSRAGQSYLAELQSIAPLTREEEWQLALRIENSEQAMLQAILEVPDLARQVCSLLLAAADGQQPIHQLLEYSQNDEVAHARLRRLVSALTSRNNDNISELLQNIRFHRKRLEDLANQVHPETHPEAAARIAKARRTIQTTKRELVRRHLWLAVRIAIRLPSRRLDLLDRIQEGNLGLMQAADRFQVRKGVRFATYAAFWVRRGIHRATAEQGYCVRLPVQVLEAAYRAEQSQRRHDAKHPDPASEQHIAQSAAMSVERLREVKRGIGDSVSIDDHDIADPMPSVEQQIGDWQRVQVLHAQVASLDNREKRVLTLRYGLESGEELSREDTANVFRLTTERIRQLENQALQRLQHPCRKTLLLAV